MTIEQANEISEITRNIRRTSKRMTAIGNALKATETNDSSGAIVIQTKNADGTPAKVWVGMGVLKIRQFLQEELDGCTQMLEYYNGQLADIEEIEL